MRGPSSINRPIHMELCQIQLLLTYGMALWACVVASLSTPPPPPILAATLKINYEKTWSQLPIKYVTFSVALPKFRRGIPWRGTKHYSIHEAWVVLACRRATTLRSMTFFLDNTLRSKSYASIYRCIVTYDKKPDWSKLPRLSAPTSSSKATRAATDAASQNPLPPLFPTSPPPELPAGGLRLLGRWRWGFSP